jgi:hypothetical protein
MAADRVKIEPPNQVQKKEKTGIIIKKQQKHGFNFIS